MVTRTSPIRTCVGCRQRVAADELLRVVATPDPAPGVSPEVVPDPRHRMPGRGAWVHPDPACVELAQRRRAFGRALRVPADTDPGPVHDYVTEHLREHNQYDTTAPPRDGSETGPAGGTRRRYEQ